MARSSSFPMTTPDLYGSGCWIQCMGSVDSRLASANVNVIRSALSSLSLSSTCLCSVVSQPAINVINRIKNRILIIHQYLELK